MLNASCASISHQQASGLILVQHLIFGRYYTNFQLDWGLLIWGEDEEFGSHPPVLDSWYSVPEGIWLIQISDKLQFWTDASFLVFALLVHFSVKLAVENNSGVPAVPSSLQGWTLVFLNIQTNFLSSESDSFGRVVTHLNKLYLNALKCSSLEMSPRDLPIMCKSIILLALRWVSWTFQLLWVNPISAVKQIPLCWQQETDGCSQSW